MEKSEITYPVEKKALYSFLKVKLQGLTDGVPYRIANLSNASALLYQALEDINWAGFYLMQEGKLVLGPFQGKPACVEIPVGRGVCGTAAERDEVILVKNVHEFPGHIACDSASRSEIVLPIHNENEVAGVLDIDSPSFARFDEEDKAGLLELVKVVEGLWAERNDVCMAPGRHGALRDIANESACSYAFK